MEKNKNRTDLLAAGRKKLQQYRQKKDGKGSKPSGKAANASNDSTSNSAPAADKQLEMTIKAPELERSASDVSKGLADILNLQSREESEASDADVSTTSTSPRLPSIPETSLAEAASTAISELPLEDSVGGESEHQHDSSASNNDGAASAINTSMERKNSSSESMEASNVDMPVSVDLSGPPDLTISSVIEVDFVHGEDQVPDVGAEQEAESSSYKQSEVEEEKRPDLSQLDENAEVLEETSLGNNVSVLPGIPAEMKIDRKEDEDDPVLYQSVVTSDETTSINPELLIQQQEDLTVGASSDSGVLHSENVEADMSGQTVHVEERSPESKVGYVEDMSSISLAQIAEVVKGLGEDEFKFLLTVRESAIQDRPLSDVWARVEEQLYLSNLEKNLFHLQLAEELGLKEDFDCQRNKLVNEISKLTVSLDESKGKISSLSLEKDDLQKQFHFAKAECEELSARADALLFKLESSQKELSECRDVVAALRIENGNLDESLTSMTEERRKVEDAKEMFLLENEKLVVELRECKASLHLYEEEKKDLFSNNDKLLTDLADSKKLSETLQLENENLNNDLASVREGREKLDEEREELATELREYRVLLDLLKEEKEEYIKNNDKLLTDLAASTDLAKTLQVENGNLNDILIKLRESKEKVDEEKEKLSIDLRECRALLDLLEEEKKAYISKNNKLLTDLTDSTDLAKALQVENENLNSTLTSLRESREMGDEEKEKLSTELRECRALLDLLEEEKKAHVSYNDKLLTDNKKLAESLQLENGTLHDVLTSLKEGKEKLDEELMGCKHLVESLEKEIVNLNGSLALEKEGRIKLQEEKDFFVKESENLSTEVAELKGRMDDLKEATLKVEQLTEENTLLASNLNLYKTKVQEFDNMQQLSRSVEASDSVEDSRDGESDEHGENANEADVELVVLYEFMKQHVHEVEAKKGELSGLYEALMQKKTDLELQLSESRSRVDELERQLNLLHQSSKERESVLEEERSSTIALIGKEVEKLDACIGAVGPTDTAGEGSHVAASINAATRFIKNLQEKIEVSCRDHDSRGNEIDELKKRCIGKDFILKLVEDIENVVTLEGSELNVDEAMSCVESLIQFLLQKYKEADQNLGMKETSMLELQGQNDQLNLSIIQHENEILVLKESLRTTMEDLEAVRSNVQGKVAKLEQSEQSLLDVQGQKDHLSHLIVEHENEIVVLKESLKTAMEDLEAARSNLQEKATELEQSEHRVSSLREKLGIAVTKGKGLIVQRDSLKNSLAETSNELERCLQELQLKDSILHDVETKLKNYSEAGERVEALESELSYIRNSATALRESFFLKDSTLQRIEEILEDLEMPENILARDIIEKVEWLVRKVPEGSTGGGSYSDSGFVVMDAWKEESQQTSNSGEDLKRKNEDLQSKFYELAEQNEMLEQSLKERNKIVQRWEEVLDKLNMPAQFRSMEPEDRIEWLGGAFSEAIHHCNSLEEKVHNSDRFCESLTADLEESERRILDLEAALHSVNTEKEHLSKNLDILSSDYDKVLEKAQFFDGENDKLQNEATDLQEKLEDSQRKISNFEAENSKLQDEITALQQKIDERIGVDEHLQHLEGEIRRFQSLVSDALQEDSNTENLVLGTSATEGLEVLLKKLLEKSANLPPGRFVPRDATGELVAIEANQVHAEKRTEKTEETAVMKKELEEALADLIRLKQEKEKLMEENQSLVHEVERLDTKRQELQELLNQEEQKSASVREKLNLAVRKGKSLVQQRDGMRQTIDEVTSEVERLKNEIKLKENALLEYHKRMEAVESERLSFRNRLAETESDLQEKGHTLSMILHALGEIDIGSEFRGIDPVEKIVKIRGRFDDLHVAVNSSENDARKSKRAAELLLAELNEVQERNDGLQEELANAASEILDLRKQIYSVETDRREREKEIVELMAVESGVDQLKKGFFDMKSILGDVLSKDLEFLHNLEAGMMSSLRSSDDAPNLVSLSFSGSVVPSSETKIPVQENLPFQKSFSDSKIQEHSKYTRVSEICSSLGQSMQNIMKEIGVIKETLYNHSLSVQGETDVLSEILASFHHEITSRRNSYESMKSDIIRLESIAREKDTENNVMRRSVSLLYEACKNSVTDLGNLKSQLLGDGQLRFNARSVPLDGDNLYSVQTLSSSEEYVRVMADSLLSAVNDFVSTQPEILEASQKEMKSTISNLQKELQEKDIQKDRICVELVGQIKAAEATATGYMQELQPSKARIVDLEKRVNELQDHESALEDLKKKERSLTDAVAAKDQEIEALMQALDEEEGQMEDMRNKIEELESVVQQKNIELETAEASRSKATKKLSVTVNKFDELHNLSANLLSEVEKLQSQLQERDSEISFLRQEVTRCTNDALVSSQMNSKRDSDGINDMVSWLGSLVSQLQLVPDLNSDSEKGNLVQEYKEILQKKIVSIVSELEDLRANIQNRDDLLQEERSRRESLENSLREKESQLTMLQGDPGQSEIVEVEPVMNKWTVPAPTSVAPQVRSLRKLNNNDQVAIAIDTEPDSNTSLLEDEDDDKAHGFKHLTTSKIVPRFTRPVSNVIDGLWVSCDRALMRQPALRLGVIIYWVVVHALLAAFVV